MSKKISMSRKKFQKARHQAWLDGHEHGLATGYRDGEAHGRDAMNAEVAGDVVAPVLGAAIGLIESGLEDYAHVLLVALRDKAREIAGEELDDMADTGDDEYEYEHECAGCCEDGQPSEREMQEAQATMDALSSIIDIVSKLPDGVANHIKPVQDGHDPL